MNCKSLLRKISGTRLIALGYLLLILVGGTLLLLPCATRAGTSAGAMSAFFTAVSASCVTGLVNVDTGTTWSVFGQVVILCLIQIGGLGFMSLFALFSMLSGRHMSLRARGLLRDSVNAAKLGDVERLFRTLLVGSCTVELLGCALLCVRFIPEFGAKGVWYALFHSVSAYCNAGFDLLGAEFAPYCSVTPYADSPLVLLTLSGLVIIGGLGFLVWQDMAEHKLHFRAYSLHAKLALSATGILLLGGTVLFFFSEKNFSMAGMRIPERLLHSFFCAVSPRTAGMNSLDLSALSPAGMLVSDILMLIGGCPGSTAGGIKTVTAAVLLICARANLRNSGSRNVFDRRITEDAERKALTVTVSALSLTAAALLVIHLLQPELAAEDVLFVVCSAVATVGLSTVELGTALLPAAKTVLMLLMYGGRVGSMSFLLIFTEKKIPSAVVMPQEDVLIG